MVGKLLVTYFQRGQSVDVLELMARVLGVSEADKKGDGARPGGARRPKGVPGRGVRARARGVRGADDGHGREGPGGRGGGVHAETETETVADQWVEFLLQQMDAEDGEVRSSPVPRCRERNEVNFRFQFEHSCTHVQERGGFRRASSSSISFSGAHPRRARPTVTMAAGSARTMSGR